MFSSEILNEARILLERCEAVGLRLAAAESCTGGLISGALTAVPGASTVFERGYVSYANAAKSAMLGVAPALIAAQGAVSEPVSRAMAEGALARAGVDLAVAVTGIAGPGGGSADKPVGLVHMAVARRGGDTLHERHVYAGDRAAIRRQSVADALRLLRQQVG